MAKALKTTSAKKKLKPKAAAAPTRTPTPRLKIAARPDHPKIASISHGAGMLFGVTDKGDVYVWNAITRSWQPNWLSDAEREKFARDQATKIAAAAKAASAATPAEDNTDPLA